MHTFSQPSAETRPSGGDDRWAQLVTELKAMLPKMQSQFVERLQENTAYSSGRIISTAELDETAAASIGLVIDSMAGSQNYSRMLEFANSLGARRARQGLSAEALMSAVRLDFPVIWSTLLNMSAPEDAALLANRAEEVWRVVDDYAAATHSSYLATRVAMAQEEAGVRQEFISALFGTQGQLPEVCDRFAKAFEVKANIPYGIAAATGSAAAKLRQLAAFPSRNNSIFLHETENYTYAFWPDPEKKSQDVTPHHSGVSPIACGLARTEEGLSGLAAAARVAAALSDLTVTADQSPITVDHHWPRLARSRMDTVGVELCAALETQLLAARSAEVERIRETVACFLENGSVGATAKALYCHRNTILNRLRRFTELTDIDVTIPAQAARAVVAWA